MLRIQEEKLAGLYSIYPTVFKDDRGYFFEAFKAANYAEITEGLPLFRTTFLNLQKEFYAVYIFKHRPMRKANLSKYFKDQF